MGEKKGREIQLDVLKMALRIFRRLEIWPLEIYRATVAPRFGNSTRRFETLATGNSPLQKRRLLRSLGNNGGQWRTVPKTVPKLVIGEIVLTLKKKCLNVIFF